MEVRLRSCSSCRPCRSSAHSDRAAARQQHGGSRGHAIAHADGRAGLGRHRVSPGDLADFPCFPGFLSEAGDAAMRASAEFGRVAVASRRRMHASARRSFAIDPAADAHARWRDGRTRTASGPARVGPSI